METNSAGDAGQYFVAGELTRRGYIATLALANTPHFDILVSKCDGAQQKAIQVKTTQNGKKRWMLSDKSEELVEDNVIYVFVCLNKLKEPAYHIVPSPVVAKYVIAKHKDWLSNQNRKKNSNADRNLRVFRDDENEYLNRWDLIFGEKKKER